jgi:hypothetical protein
MVKVCGLSRALPIDVLLKGDTPEPYALLGVRSGLPNFIAENTSSNKHELLSPRILAVFGEGCQQRRVDTRLPRNPRLIDHELIIINDLLFFKLSLSLPLPQTLTKKVYFTRLIY